MVPVDHSTAPDLKNHPNISSDSDHGNVAPFELLHHRNQPSASQCGKPATPATACAQNETAPSEVD